MARKSKKLQELQTMFDENDIDFSKVKVTIQKFIENINKVPTKTIDRLCVKM